MAGILFRTAGRLLKWPLTVLIRPYPRLNARVWDLQYALGLWSYLDQPGSGSPLDLIQKYAPQARILDLGCGTTVNLPLVPGSYRHYHGVDISRTAIRRARSLRRADASFEVADVLSYQPAGQYDVILLREILYYFPLDDAMALLHRLAPALTPHGAIIVGVYDTGTPEGAALLDRVRDCGLAVAEELAEPSEGGLLPVTIVLRTATGAGVARLRASTTTADERRATERGGHSAADQR
ncbi:class I SAM-dependent methyltransferase [Phytohabitans flavus]|nr:class I SAM-dependent methyltransferase [Phytohabitans flavus]